MTQDMHGNNVDKAINEAVCFFKTYLEESNKHEPKMITRINERRKAQGLGVKPRKINSDEDIERFLSSLRKFMEENFSYRNRIVFVVDYHPIFELREILEKSGIEDIEKFTHRAYFMSKMQVSVFPDKVTLKDGSTVFPNVWTDLSGLEE